MKIALVRANNYEFESRLQKEYAVANQVGQTSLVVWNRQGTNPKLDKNIHALHLRSPYGKKIILYLPIWFVYVFCQLIKLNPNIVQACNIESIIPSWLYAKLFGKKLIYDIWDTAGGMFGGNNKQLQSLLNRFDRFFALQANYVLAPDQARLEQLGCHKDKRIFNKFLVVYNSDKIKDQGVREFNFAQHKTIHLSYVGTLVRESRGLEQLIKAVAANNRFVLNMAGYGGDSDYFKQYFKNNSVANIKFEGRVPHTRADNINQKADIMVSLLDPNFKNYKFATSTKVFEAFSACKPIISTLGSASGELVEQTKWGVAIAFNQAALDETLKNIASGKIRFTLNSALVKQYSWEQVAQRLSRVYQELATNRVK